MATNPETAIVRDSDTLMSIANCIFERHLRHKARANMPGAISQWQPKNSTYKGWLNFPAISYDTHYPAPVTSLRIELDGIVIRVDKSKSHAFDRVAFDEELIETVINYALDEGFVCERGLFSIAGRQPAAVDHETRANDAQLFPEAFDIDQQHAAQSDDLDLAPNYARV